MGGACCAKTDLMPEDYILNIYNTLRIRNCPFQKIYEIILNKEFNTKNLLNLSKEKLNFVDFKRITEDLFYNIRDTDELHYNMHKQIFDQILKFYTKPNGEICILEIMTLFLYFANNNNVEKTNFFCEMRAKDFQNPTKFKSTLLYYLKDTIYLLSNIVVEYIEYDTPDSLYYFLSSFTQKKVESYFEKFLHKDLEELTADTQKMHNLLNDINFIFNYNKLRENYLFYFKEERIGDFTCDNIKNEIAIYTQIRKKSF